MELALLAAIAYYAWPKRLPPASTGGEIHLTTFSTPM